VRFSAPSLIFEVAGVGGKAGEAGGEGEKGGRRLEAGGFQTIQAYDVLIANLDPTLRREPPPEDPLLALKRNPDGLVTQEVAAIMAHGNDPPDRMAAERALVELVGAGSARRISAGNDAIWQVV
jgi:hypothetical protein